MTTLPAGTAARNGALRRQALFGMTWLGLSQVGLHLIAVATSLTLARLLTPAQFGIAAMATVAVGIVSTVANLGLPTAIVHRETLTETHLDSAFWTLLGWGTVLWVGVALLSPALAAFYQAPAVTGLMTLHAGTLFLAAAAAVPNGLLVRAMDFRRLAWIELGAGLTAAGVSIVLALDGWGSWSLIWGPVAGSLMAAGAAWAWSGWRPRARAEREALRDLLSYGLDLSGFTILNYLRTNVDYLLVGRWLGAEALGVYTKAYELVTLPQSKLVPVVTRVLFPAFSRMQDDPTRLRQAYVKLNAYVALMSVPLLLGLALVAPELVPLLFGGQWTGAILPTQILCAAGLLYANGTTVGVVLFSQGRTRLALRIAVWGLAGITACVAAGSRFGVAGVAWGIVAYATLAFPVVQHLTNRVIGLPMRDLLRGLHPAAVSGALMGAAVLIARWVVTDFAPWLRLLLLVGFGATVYLGALRVAFREHFNEVRGILRDLVRTTPGEPA
ncbi:MAG: MOP flippase family protein [candidate division NC10 bacterium]|nr:MOP flippase family protein [candidate division NC10 bacterium]